MSGKKSTIVLFLACAAGGMLAASCGHSAPPKARVPVIEGLGSYHREATHNAAAAPLFDQGLRLIYAFNHDEAERAFEEAARLDPACVACYWGAALALGPNINLPADPARTRAAVVLLRKTQPHLASASPVEQALVGALAVRYSDPPPSDAATQAQLDRAYADAMRKAAQQFPDDDDVQVLFAESLMDLRPWNLWTPDGKPQPGTDEILATLEKVLARAPDHPGANHYYIHAVEASPHPERALAAAGKVGTLMPAAGHLVHMPSHIYLRMGRYDEAAEANRRAIAADRAYLDKYNPQGHYAMYVAHNFQFLWETAILQAHAADALDAARGLVKAFPAEMMKTMPGTDFILAAPALTLARFGRWDEVLAETPPAAEFKIGVALYEYAHGRALLGKGKALEATDALAALDAAAEGVPADAMLGVAPARTVLTIAHNLLAGVIAAARPNGLSDAVKLLKQAVEDNDKLGYDEPPDWYYPPRQTLGAVLLRAGRAAAAESVFREDLRRNPDNAWSLLGLERALRTVHRTREADELTPRVRKAFEKADVTPVASDF